MHDSRLEDALRVSLRDEAESLPFTVSTGLLQRRLAERRRQVGTSRRWLLAAAVAVVALGGGAALYLRGSAPPPPVGTLPSATTTTPLPEPAALLAGFPSATLRLEGSVGPAVRAGDPPSSPDPAPPVEVGRVTIEGPFVLATVCRGPGELTVMLGDGSSPAVAQVTTPCDGQPHPREYLADPPLSGPDGFVVTVSAGVAASWRLAIGTYPSDLGVAPVFPPIAPTAGWNQVVDPGASLVSPTSGTGVSFQVPGEATRIGVQVRCQGVASVTFVIGTSSMDPMECTGTLSSHRFEAAATGGERLRIRATADGFVWIRYIVETDASIATTYPSAPPVPAAVAGTPYAETTLTMVGLGTIGGNRQTVLPLRQAMPGVTTGATMPLAIFDAATGSSRLVLLSVPRGEIVATLATVAGPGLFLASWADAEHQQVFYAMTADQQAGALQYHRVGFDGSDDQVLAEAPTGVDQYLFGGSSAGLALDGSAFVIDICEGAACHFAIVDTETGALREVERSSETYCSILGIAGANVVAIDRDACSPFDGNFTFDGVSRIVALPLDGGAGRTLLDGAADGQVDGLVVDTPTGPRLVFTRLGGGTDYTVEAMDIATGQSVVLLTRRAGDPLVTPRPVRLPPGWVLLATMSLGDFPQAALGPRAVPILIDLVTARQYEMVNLPH